MSVSKIVLVIIVWLYGLVVGPKHMGYIMHIFFLHKRPPVKK